MLSTVAAVRPWAPVPLPLMLRVAPPLVKLAPDEE